MDLSQYVPGSIGYPYELQQGEYNNTPITFLTNAAKEVLFVALVDENGNFYFYSYNEETKTTYPAYIYQRENGDWYLYTSPYAIQSRPEKLTDDMVSSFSVIYAIDADGNGKFSYFDENNRIIALTDSDYSQQASGGGWRSKSVKIFWICLIILAVGAVILIPIYHRQQMIRKQEQKAQARKRAMERAVASTMSGETTITEPKVISVQDVTMEFKVSTSNASGLKEYLIQVLKHQVTYRKLKALNHVSFDIYKGEVVGIIGTNGSGKSTVLKIVSGALRPTEGKVKVDRSKVQLLTLGTGFDMELSARENVYLNGAIIGYTRQFIDEHYQEIVDFAELDGFMEEKVKNFSSGMVSRLGFAVATVGDAAEILILDEVLSVGDEFFRKKSLARVKEMIHGGSTVLMVSHSMSTILDNCTKVVWIEKGDLRMVGDPKVVCKEYQKQNQ